MNFLKFWWRKHSYSIVAYTIAVVSAAGWFAGGLGFVWLMQYLSTINPWLMVIPPLIGGVTYLLIHMYSDWKEYRATVACTRATRPVRNLHSVYVNQPQADRKHQHPGVARHLTRKQNGQA